MKLAISGANVAILDRLEDELAETKRLCEEHGVTARTYLCDVTDVEGLRGVIAEAESHLGDIE